jgi:hypothetical protein
LASGQRYRPRSCLAAKSAQDDSAMRVRETLQAPQTGLQQSSRTASVASRIVMKSGGDLNDALQERFLRFGRA